jgi:hypothetical protein
MTSSGDILRASRREKEPDMRLLHWLYAGSILLADALILAFVLQIMAYQYGVMEYHGGYLHHLLRAIAKCWRT